MAPRSKGRNMNNVGARLKALRLAKGLSQSDVIRRSGSWVLTSPEWRTAIPSPLSGAWKGWPRLSESSSTSFLRWSGPASGRTIERECAEQIRQAMAERDQILKKVQAATLRLSEHLGYMSKLVASGLGIKQIAQGSSRGRRATPTSRTLSKARRG